MILFIADSTPEVAARNLIRRFAEDQKLHATVLVDVNYYDEDSTDVFADVLSYPDPQFGDVDDRSEDAAAVPHISARAAKEETPALEEEEEEWGIHDSFKVFIKNLTNGVTHDDLVSALKNIGTVEKTLIFKNHEGTNSKRFSAMREMEPGAQKEDSGDCVSFDPPVMVKSSSSPPSSSSQASSVVSNATAPPETKLKRNSKSDATSDSSQAASVRRYVTPPGDDLIMDLRHLKVNTTHTRQKKVVEVRETHSHIINKVVKSSFLFQKTQPDGHAFVWLSGIEDFRRATADDLRLFGVHLMVSHDSYFRNILT